MAGKSGFLGELYYSITGEDNLKKILQEDKALAQEVAKIAGGIKIGKTRITQDAAKTILAEQNAAEKIAQSKLKTALFEQKIAAATSNRIAVDEKAITAMIRREPAEINLQNAQDRRAAVQRKLSQTEETAIGSIKMLEAELKKLKDTYRSLSEVDRNSGIGRSLLTTINNADENLAKINAEMANNAALAKTMGTQYNGLRTQINMVARELPNLGISLSTFILSLSNNLPYLADEIAKANKEFNELKKTNQAATPVWKQMVGAVLNWQTALIVGITVLTAYSREIQAWVQELIKGGKAASFLAQSQEKLNELQKESTKNSSAELAKLESLYSVSQNTALSLEARRKAVEKLQQQYPDYLGKLSEEYILTGKASDAYQALTDNIIKAASLKIIDEQRKEAINKIAESREKEGEAVANINRLLAEMPKENTPEFTTYLEDPNNKYGQVKYWRKRRDEERAYQRDILDNLKTWQNEYSSIFQDIVNNEELTNDQKIEGIFDVYKKELIKLDRSLSLSELTQDEYNAKVNDAKGELLAAADAAKVTNDNIEQLRLEYVKFNKESQHQKQYKIEVKEENAVFKRQQEYLKASKALEDAVLQSERNLEQSQINLLKEGSEKQLAQIELNYKKRKDEVKKQIDEYVKLVQDEELKAWKEKNPAKKESEFKPTTVDFNTLPQELKDKIYQQEDLADKEYAQNKQGLLENLLTKYQDFATRRKTIEEQFNNDIAALNAKRTDENGEEIDRAVKVAKDKMKEALKSITEEENKTLANQDNTFLKRLFGDVSEMGFSDLSKLIEQARQLRSYLSGNGDVNGIEFISPEQLKAIEESPAELDKLKKALEGLLSGGKSNSWDNIFEGFTKGLAKLKSAKGFKEVSEGLQDIGSAASTASSMLGDVAGDLSSMFEEMGNTKAADAMSGVQDAMSAISNIGQGFAKGGIIGGIAAAVGEAANFIGKAFAAEARHQAALKEIMDETISQQREYNLLLLQQNLEYEKAETIFGTDAYGKAANAVNVLEKAMSGLNNELLGTVEQQKSQSKDAFFKKVFGIADPQAELKKAYAGLADIEVKTGHKKTGIFGWGKGKDIYSSILDVYPDLIDSAGKFNKELAETIINTREMSEEDKAALQNLIDLSQTAEDALQEMNDYLTGIFGDFGGTLSDALVDAFSNGSDAAKSFTKSVSDMLENLATQMAYSLFIGPELEKAQKEISDIMLNTALSDAEKFEKAGEVVDKATDNIMKDQDKYNAWLQDRKDEAKDKGYDIFEPDKQSGLTGATKNITEDQADIIGSYLNAMRADLSAQRVDVHTLTNIINADLPIISAMAEAQLIQLNNIANNTLAIAGYTGKNADNTDRILDILDGARRSKEFGLWIK